MNTLAVPEVTTSATRLTRRPAPLTLCEEDMDSAAIVVRMPRRNKEPSGLETAGLPAWANAAPDAAGQSSTTEANIPVPLDTTKSEQALVKEMTRKISIAALEVISGARSVQQLSRWLDTRSFNALSTRARLHAQACQSEERRSGHSHATAVLSALHQHPIVHSIHCFQVSPGIYETSVVVADKTRFRAMALRLEETRGTWKVTALRIG